jgi:hypothetical protein
MELELDKVREYLVADIVGYYEQLPKDELGFVNLDEPNFVNEAVFHEFDNIGEIEISKVICNTDLGLSFFDNIMGEKLDDEFVFESDCI